MQETHNQPLSRPQEILWKAGRIWESEGSRALWENTQGQMTWAHESSWTLQLNILRLGNIHEDLHFSERKGERVDGAGGRLGEKTGREEGRRN